MSSEICSLHLTHPLLQSSGQLLCSTRWPDANRHRCFLLRDNDWITSHVFDCGENQSASEETPHKHGENAQTPHKKAVFTWKLYPEPSCHEARLLATAPPCRRVLLLWVGDPGSTALTYVTTWNLIIYALCFQEDKMDKVVNVKAFFGSDP